jgi:hypothetical protein
MPDLSLYWNDDLTVGPNGDLSLVDQVPLSNQHIIRRLMTATQSYIWHLDYGAGLPQRIGRPARALEIQSLVTAHINLEPSVARLPVPRVSVNPAATLQGAFIVTINYVEAGTNAQRALTFDTTGNVLTGVG